MAYLFSSFCHFRRQTEEEYIRSFHELQKVSSPFFKVFLLYYIVALLSWYFSWFFHFDFLDMTCAFVPVDSQVDIHIPSSLARNVDDSDILQLEIRSILSYSTIAESGYYGH